MVNIIKWMLGLAKAQLFLLLIFSFAAVGGETIKLGNGIRENIYATGKSTVEIHQSHCLYSMLLLKGQRLRFNTPDVVFFESKSNEKIKDWPYLSQAETSFGYSWSFKKKSGLNSKWFGLMCDNAKYFDFEPAFENQLSSDSPELPQIKNDNAFKCPGALSEAGWRPTEKAGAANSYVFEEIKNENLSGFIIGYKNKDTPTFGRVTFCLIKGESVLLGSAENAPEPLSISAKTFSELKRVASGIVFLN